MSTVNQKNFIAIVAEEVDYPQTVVKEMLYGILDTITNELAAGNEINLTGFGKFATVERAARKGFNPATGKHIQIAASTGIKFKAGTGLKNAVNS